MKKLVVVSLILLLALVGCFSNEAPSSATTESKENAVAPVDELQVSDVLAKLSAEDAAHKAAALKEFARIEVDEVDKKKVRTPAKASKYINSRSSVHAKVITDLQDNVTAVLVLWAHVADDWLFFKQATIAVGDFRGTVTFKDPTTDNGGGKVWEYANLVLREVVESSDFVPGYTLPVETAEQMVSPEKVTIRFEGRKFYSDYELKTWEKDSIRAALVLARPKPTRADALALLAEQAVEKDELAAPNQ